MQTLFNYVVGVDISKKTFDACLSDMKLDTDFLEHKAFANSAKGCKAFIKWLKAKDVILDQLVICMENTGIYHRLLASFLSDSDLSVWVETATQIKFSAGMTRGKTDKVDSERIMLYAKRHLDLFKAYKKKDKHLQQLADLLALRKRLQTNVIKLKVPAKELKAAGLVDSAKLIERATRASVKALEKDIASIKQKMEALISNNEHLKEVYSQITSVKSVGFVAACYLMVYTDCFTKFKSSKQIASYCGIAPFEYASGTSVRGRTRVHHLANKNLKTVLHMCAISSLAHNDEMKIYAERKVAEGKNKMSILNAIRNKLLSRVFSCVKNKKMYVPYKVA